ncbi:RNA polymerase sigma factor [Paenibacillus polysaccharolyticus]|uniref:RNA polymerase sigma factor n=1 Tax=Paenibacillus cucumis (ex Kampfer et al. 2016) TaxID=1776858 RepID=A0ABS7KFC5_9BACL|nr:MULTISPECIES: RNA polymerase sigma factor [Paenibacillus]MBY0202646.1 RNA polymerase sigma factor [Paenibacillus cucumis (ex Kampfer et al. 2016)]MCP1137031.1 RNA polymerase sigma factor [Paenibacillus polysaccharolyticus]
MTEKELFEMYNKDVYRTCYYMLHHAQNAEDVCHDVFITVFRQDWRKVDYMKTWLMKITVNHCLNFMKREHASKQREKRLFMLTPQRTVDPVDEVAQHAEESDLWEQWVQELPEKIRSAILLRYMNEFSLSETAETLEVPLGTVKSRIYKGIRLLRKKWEKASKQYQKGEVYSETYRKKIVSSSEK